MEKAKVYFIKEITPENVVKIYEKLGKKLSGKVAVKVHSGEEGNQNYLHPEFMKPMIEYVNGTVVECNTAYEGARDTTEKHMKLLEDHGWSKYFKVDILDSDNETVLENPKGEVIKKNIVGEKMKNYATYEDMFSADHDSFLKAMADSAKTITDFYEGKIVYINAMVNMSVDCDCCKVAADPCMKDIGILASTDPVAIDQACIDLVYNSKDKGRDELVERIESRNGLLTIESAEKQEIGSREYELISIDE